MHWNKPKPTFFVHHSKVKNYIYICLFIILFISCKKDVKETCGGAKTTPYIFPDLPDWKDIVQDPENPVTNEGVYVGRKLFYDPILSKDFTVSCSTCHKPENSFSDPSKFSQGVDGTLGDRNSMALVNLTWGKKFFWDGRSATLREQALIPVPHEKEMKLAWEDAVDRLNKDEKYKDLFCQAFGTSNITKELVTKALAQFEMTLISYNSQYDRFLQGTYNPDASFFRGLNIFITEKGDCFHCHALAAIESFADPIRVFTNNGMDEVSDVNAFSDLGVGGITGADNDKGKFKIPTLRNLAFTAPYMHDGRFKTLDEVIDSYNLGPQQSPTVDNILIVKANYRLENFGHWGLNLTDEEKQDLKNFLLSFSDTSFVNNPAFQKPVE
ncbi:MAG: cytochrome-c peroxidase [Chitinophagales bacterium]|nr:cytochrome-c peroxidase [Chitinophagales bacterium]